MRITQHPSNNFTLGAPEGWDQGELPVDALPVTCGDVSGVPVMVSFWLPEPEEIAAMAAGQPVMLHIFGTVHPIVALAVEEPGNAAKYGH